MNKINIDLAPMFEFCDKAEINGRTPTHDILKQAVEFLMEEVAETDTAVAEGVVEETLDGFIDTAFVALNGAYKLFQVLGFSADEGRYRVAESFHRVCSANMAKFINGVAQTDKNGKVIKPNGWQPPDFDDLLVKIDYKC